MSKFNAFFTSFFALILCVSLLGIWAVVNPEIDEDGETSEDAVNRVGISLTQDQENSLKASVKEAVLRAGSFGVESVESTGGAEKFVAEVIEDPGSILKSRGEVYSGLDIPTTSPLHTAKVPRDEWEESTFSSFVASDVKLGKITSWKKGESTFASTDVEFVSLEKMHSISIQDLGSGEGSLTILGKERNVSGSVTMKENSGSWILWDVDINHPYVLVTWKPSSEYLQERAIEEVLEEIPFKLEEK